MIALDVLDKSVPDVVFTIFSNNRVDGFWDISDSSKSSECSDKSQNNIKQSSTTHLESCPIDVKSMDKPLFEGLRPSRDGRI